MKTAAGWLALVTIALAGCTRNAYDLELNPVGDSLERKLTVKQVTTGASDPPAAFDDEARRIAREYQVPAPAAGKTHVFQGTFAGRMPSDIGGSGTFTRWDTPFGSAAVYVERFRGNDDPAGILKRRQATADRVTDLLVAWLERELGHDRQWPELRRFLQQDFRRDLYNVTIYAWAGTLNDRTEQHQESTVRVLQYAVERGYFKPDEVPMMKRALADCDRGDYDRFAAWLARFLESRAPGRPFNVPKHLANPEGLVDSLTGFLETTDEYAKLVRDWQEQLKKDPDAKKPDGGDVANDLVARLFYDGISYQTGVDRLTAGLKTGRPAIFTNGRWSADSERVQWEDRELTRDGLPQIFYAVWDEPDEICQASHFGAVVLRGEPLFDYCLWYYGLSADERGEWDTFVEELTPESDLEKALRAFRFGDEPAERDRDECLASATVAAIMRGLKEPR